MPRGRPRKHNPSMPAHIDQAKLPPGIYWDPSGTGRWYVREPHPEGLGSLTPTVAGPKARLSDLHAIMEQRRGGAAAGTLGALMGHFHESAKFKAFAKDTRRDYAWCRKVLEERKLASGMTWAQLQADRITTPLVQRLVEAIAADGGRGKPTPAKANHVLRYLRRLFSWGVQRGHCRHNPAKGVEAAPEAAVVKMPSHDAYAALLAYARACGALTPHTKGSCPGYIAPLMEISLLCRLRGIEAVTLTEAAALPEGIQSNRRKGSRDNITRWTPRLRAAWDAALAERARVLARPQHASRPTPLRAEDRALFLSEDGTPLTKSAYDSAWQSLVRRAKAAGVITAGQHFSPHGLKHRGITDSADKRAGGHVTEQMRQRYDHELPLVDPPRDPPPATEFSGEFSGGKKKGT